MAIRIQQFILEPYHSNTYLISVEQEQACYLVDLGNAKDAIASLQQDQYIKAVFLTHAHYDHIADIHYVLEKFPNCSIYCSPYTQEALADSKLNLSFYHQTPVTFSGDNIVVISENVSNPIFKDLAIQVMATSGHNAGCLTFKLKNNFFTGDALIPGRAIVTKLKSGNKIEAKNSIRKLKRIVKPDDVIYPGHGEAVLVQNINWDFYEAETNL
ncbi:MBL fold metallo-hydrolase [Flavobacterium sp.]|uniref:MBL fold metallo-hydrolase n=1 Tax=Flavobacterium sp. TaxID=239 RepID=UPI004047AF16